MHFPGFSEAAAQMLLERSIAGIGIDTLSIDRGASTDFPVHKLMLGSGKFQIENLANLDALPPTGTTAIIGVLPVRDGTQAQARIFALLP
ncbi:MAG: cyclase family protein [Gammaproteobacteria bacterium]